MDHSLERLQRYSWHQATVLLLVPYETIPDDISVIIEKNYLVAGVRGHPAIVKGRLYSAVDTANSAWQLETRISRRRTISSTSSHSSFAIVSDPDISSSFAASLDNGRESEADEYNDLAQSPVLSSPSSNDEITPRHRDEFVMPQMSGMSSPPGGPSLTSSFSSTESLHSARSGRLLTLHLEKAESIIWPSLVIGSVPSSLSPSVFLPEDMRDSDLQMNEDDFNMDPTSLSLMAIDMLDIRQERVEAFEHLIRAWYQGRIPVSTLRLVTNYVPLQVPISHVPSSADSPTRGSASYYVKRLGGATGLAHLYLEAGLLHLEGAASLLMSSSSTALSSLRSTESYQALALRETGTDGWRRDREAARRYFERAKMLDPSLDVPVLPPEGDELGSERDPRTPATDARSKAPSVSAASRASSRRDTQENFDVPTKHRRRRKTKEERNDSTMRHSSQSDDDLWYLYVPGVVGAVIAVGVVGALSLTTWRKNQG